MWSGGLGRIRDHVGKLAVLTSLGGMGYIFKGVYMRKQASFKALPAPLVVATDLDSSDMFALLVLKLRGIEPKALLVGVGVGDGDGDGDDATESKRVRAMTCARLLGWARTEILACAPTKTEFATTLNRVLNGREDQCGFVLKDDSVPVRVPTLLYFKAPHELVLALQHHTALFANTRLVIPEHRATELRPWMTSSTCPFQQIVVLRKQDFNVFLGTLNSRTMTSTYDIQGPYVKERFQPDSDLGKYCSAVRAAVGEQIDSTAPVLALLLDNPRYISTETATKSKVGVFKTLPEQDLARGLTVPWRHVFGFPKPLNPPRSLHDYDNDDD